MLFRRSDEKPCSASSILALIALRLDGTRPKLSPHISAPRTDAHMPVRSDRRALPPLASHKAARCPLHIRTNRRSEIRPRKKPDASVPTSAPLMGLGSPEIW